VRRALNRWCAAQADAVVAVSEHARHMLQDEWGIPERKLRVLRNAVDTNRFRPARDQTERDECRRLLGMGRSNNAVVCVANLLPIKNLDGLLRAWRQVAMMDPFARLVLVGHGPLREELERLAIELRCDGTVRFLGSRSDVPLLLRGADVSVLASRYEGTSNAVLESMASGLAVVASDVGGTPELLTPNRTGWLVNGEDPHRFAEVLLAALQERAARQRVAVAARECAVKHFSLDAWIAGHERLYREVAAKRPVTFNERGASCAE
jgi:glycosyltransferase involved in cell wall biosynthesis